MGSGLQRVCKMYGGMVINGEKFVWDYVADEAVPEAEMPVGSERHKASERVRWGVDKRPKQQSGKSEVQK